MLNLKSESRLLREAGQAANLHGARSPTISRGGRPIVGTFNRTFDDRDQCG